MSKEEFIQNLQLKARDLKSMTDEEKVNCELCDDTGVVEIMGGTDYDDWTVIDTKRCKCQE